MKLLVRFLSCVAVVAAQSGDPVVQTGYGPVEGFRYTSPSGYETEVFLGFPYASPPVGNLRFEKPVPPTSWTTPVQAKAFGNICITRAPTPATSSENCLFMNVIKPKAPSSNPKGYPVMFWVHGGSFALGSAADYPYNETAARIVAKDVIYVSINYRQSIFGYLASGDVEGNYALWDIIEALKFVQNEIHHFGGNPEEVTLWGQSSGSIIVEWLHLSPVTKNLFKRVITMSGSNLGTIGKINGAFNYSRKLIDALGCSCAVNTKACLKTKTAAEISNVVSLVSSGSNWGDAIVQPIPDGVIIPSLNTAKLALLAKKRDILTGLNEQEWVVFLVSASAPNNSDTPINMAKANGYNRTDFETLVRNVFATAEFYGPNATQAGQDIIDYYTAQPYPSNYNQHLQHYAQLISDLRMPIPIIRDAKLKAATGHKVYTYLNTFTPQAYLDAYFYNQIFYGSTHSGELWNFFGNAFAKPNVPLVGDAAKVQTTFSNLFTNFAKSGNPNTGTLTIPRANFLTVPYLEVKPNSTIKFNLMPGRVVFWDHMAKKYGYDLPETRKVADLLQDFFTQQIQAL